MVAATAAPAKTDAKAAPAPLRPFFTGTLDLETRTQTYTNPLSTSAVPLPTFYPKTNGFLADLWIRLVASGGATAGTLQTVNDGILGYLAAITLSDTGGQPILGPLTGHEFAMFVKWGGFSFSDDPRNSETFTEVSTVGNGSVTLHIPIQFVRAEPLGPLPNTNSNNAYALDITQAAASAVFSANPGTLPSVLISIYQDSYRQSAGKDAQGNATVTTPPGLGAVLYARRGTNTPTAGGQDFQLSQQEGSYRALHFIMKDSANSRTVGDTDWPNPVQIYFNNDVPYDRTKDQFIRRTRLRRVHPAVHHGRRFHAGGRRGSVQVPFRFRRRHSRIPGHHRRLRRSQPRDPVQLRPPARRQHPGSDGPLIHPRSITLRRRRRAAGVDGE
jgi:hypothetical protein